MAVGDMLFTAGSLCWRRGVAALLLDMRLIARLASAGATVLAEPYRGEPVLKLASGRRGYLLRIAGAECPAPRFLFHDEGVPIVIVVRRCGGVYRLVGDARAYFLSGIGWRLYKRE